MKLSLRIAGQTRVPGARQVRGLIERVRRTVLGRKQAQAASAREARMVPRRPVQADAIAIARRLRRLRAAAEADRRRR